MDKLQKLQEKWKKEKELLKLKEKINTEKSEIIKERKTLSHTKKYMIFIFASASIIELFTGYLMLKQFELAEYALSNGMMYTPDLAPQTTLITTVVSEVVAFAIYSLKSLKEKSVGGIEYEQYVNNNKDCGVG